MPAKSQAQRAYLNMKFGHAWVKEHHFDNKGSLPEHAKSAAKKMMAGGNKKPDPSPSLCGNPGKGSVGPNSCKG